MRYRSDNQRKAVMARINSQRLQPYGRMDSSTSRELERKNLEDFHKKQEYYRIQREIKEREERNQHEQERLEKEQKALQQQEVERKQRNERIIKNLKDRAKSFLKRLT